MYLYLGTPTTDAIVELSNGREGVVFSTRNAFTAP